jgi:hypothetical protein
MPGPLSFDAFLGWVNITDPNNIPQDARVVGADDLLRYEKLGVDTVAAVNDLAAEVESFDADESVAATLATPTSATRAAVELLVTDSVDGLQEVIDGVPAQVTAKLATDVPPAVASAIAADATITAAASAAVDTKVTGLSLVKTSDPGVAVAGEPDSPYSVIWKNKFMQMIMALTSDNKLQLFKGLTIGDKSMSIVTDDEYAFSMRDGAGRVAENAIRHDGTVPLGTLLRWRTRMGLDPAGAANLKTTYTVKKDGTGDYTSVKLANAAFVEGPGKTCEIIVYPGTYTDNEYVIKEGVTVRGILREACILDGSLPASATDTQITNTSTIWVRKTCRLENLTILMKNGRYAVHAEDSGGSKDARHDIINCHIEHLGNHEVAAYRTANALPAGSVWASDRAWGYGSSSGWYERFENCTLVSRRGAWYVHDNKDFDRPMNNELINCRIIARDGDAGTFDIQPLGAGQTSRVSVRGSETSFLHVYEADNPWITQKPENQVANHSQILATIEGTAPVGFRTANRGSALKIESASTAATSTVRVTGGTAVPILWGDGTYRDGGGGLKGYGYGYWDISGILVSLASNITVDNTLGRRLGDCSITPKTLLVSVDGGAPITVTFNQNHTAQSNATILGLINAALGSAAVASEYQVSQGETYPNFPDRQRTLKNDGTVGIPRWAPVKAGALGGIELFGLADPASAMIGVALEPVPPGKIGRILTSGLLWYIGQTPGFPGAINPGTIVYHSDTTAGTYSATGTRKAFTGHVSGWARF